MMLHEFISDNLELLIEQCRIKVAKRFSPTESSIGVDHGVPQFLEQLVQTLTFEKTTDVRSSGADEPTPSPTEIGRAAALHGAELLRRGFTVDQVVHDYGDVCQTVTALAVEQNAQISTDEFRTLNRCLDNAIADAVSAYGAGQKITTLKRIDEFTAEHERLLDVANKSLSALQTGNIGISGATGMLLAHSIKELGELTKRALPLLMKVKGERLT